MASTRIAVALLLALLASAARAGGPLDLALEPNAPIDAGDAAFARVRSAQCVSLPASVAPVRQGMALRVRIPVQDYCEPVGAQDRRYALPPLAAGTYVVVLQSCSGNVPPGVEPCVDVERIPLVVTGNGGAPVSVPTAGPGALVLLALSALAAAAMRLRPRHAR